MVVNVTCPTCGNKCRFPEEGARQGSRCPACLNLVPIESAPPSLLARSPVADPAPADAVNRTVLAQPEPMIRYSCPRCKKSLESPASLAGQKLHCPECNQRLQIPQPSTPPPPVNKTMLAVEETRAPSITPGPSSYPPPPPAVPPPGRTAQGKAGAEPWDAREAVPDSPTRDPSASSTRREHCLECGVDLTQHVRVHTCPECGSLLCSARCYREHSDHAHAPQEQPRPRRPRCPYCGSTAAPYYTNVISQAGWITFALLLVFCFPLFWIGLLITEPQRMCSDCNARLG
jgi:DNA-directed RNA polymerase subunit RPC12/RpoP